MKQNAASPCRAIRITTMIYFAITLGFLVGSFFVPWLWVATAILSLAAFYCYFFWAPVAYELDGDSLTVVFRATRKVFRPLIRCSLVEEPLSMWNTLRVCGNGGLFAGSGFFWNQRHGLFRAYVTRSKHTEWVLVETERWKIILSPEYPQGFVKAYDRN